MEWDGEAVEGIGPVSPFQDVCVDVWGELGTGVGVVVVVLGGVLVGFWLWFRDVGWRMVRRHPERTWRGRRVCGKADCASLVVLCVDHLGRISCSVAFEVAATVAAGAAVILVGSGRSQRWHFHLERGDVVLGCTDASCLDVESSCGPSVGTLGPGLSKADEEVDDPDDEADHHEEDEHEEQSLRVERES